MASVPLGSSATAGVAPPSASCPYRWELTDALVEERLPSPRWAGQPNPIRTQNTLPVHRSFVGRPDLCLASLDLWIHGGINCSREMWVRERRTWGDGSIRSCGDEDGRRKREKGDNASKKIIFLYIVHGAHEPLHARTRAMECSAASVGMRWTSQS